ncbi:hypothetical protein [Amycolatopsis sp. CA-128772]|nr:hypothetical protein [Amycolatopsis sp. CA-128772]
MTDAEQEKPADPVVPDLPDDVVVAEPGTPEAEAAWRKHAGWS